MLATKRTLQESLRAGSKATFVSLSRFLKLGPHVRIARYGTRSWGSRSPEFNEMSYRVHEKDTFRTVSRCLLAVLHSNRKCNAATWCIALIRIPCAISQLKCSVQETLLIQHLLRPTLIAELPHGITYTRVC